MPLTLVELGSRIKLVREVILVLNQSELANLLGTKQVSISNLENGKGGKPTLIFSFLNLLHSRGYNGSVIFKDFSDGFDPSILNISMKEKAIECIKRGEVMKAIDILSSL